MISNVCTDDGCRGEDVTKMSAIHRIMGNTPHPNPTPIPFPTPRNTPTPTPTPRPNPSDNVFTSATKVAIPDNNPQGITSEIDVPVIPNGRKVTVTVNIAHTYVGDLVLILTAPDQTSVVLSSRTGGAARNINGTYGVNLMPRTSLSPLSQVSATGKWRLTVSDNDVRDLGTLNGWSLHFSQ